MKKSRSLARRLETGGTILGFMAGLIFGLSIAVFVAIFVTRAPVPFVNKIGKSSDRVTEPKSAADAPDPNKPLYSKNRPGGGAGSSEAPTQPSVLGGILNNPDNKPAPKPVSPAVLPPVAVAPATAPPAPASPVTMAPPAEAKPTDPPKDDKTNYTLQAGAFKLQEDADSMKARLALIGFEARILTAEVNGQSLYRVRVGPYVGLEDMNKVRVKLAESGIEASVIRQR